MVLSCVLDITSSVVAWRMFKEARTGAADVDPMLGGFGGLGSGLTGGADAPMGGGGGGGPGMPGGGAPPGGMGRAQQQPPQQQRPGFTPFQGGGQTLGGQ
eukprot:TRINITY_DN5886_c1_g1_i2.p3 TRINITY_DN5886_c1_g1~~TRINITY_DN5886_c1_g1_i2.p3  ORF type:complete len:100 (-),score=29.62 TRINITY_DN5886_c1_g1_i2:56-355(-)